MIRTPVPFLLAALAAPLAAQSTLAELQQRFAKEAQALDAKRADQEQREALLRQHLDQLTRFLADTAKGDDRWNGRLMLADLNLARGDRKSATAALKDIDGKEAPPLLLVTAATMAQHLNLKTERQAMIDAALARTAPLADRLAMARMLVTVLHEVERGEKVFAAALAEAKDDDGRAFVRWHMADAKRDREDLPDNAAYEDLEALAKELPGTYWGGVARDRLRMTQLKPGEPAIPFTATTTTGATWSVTEPAGKAVVLVFFALGDHDNAPLATLLTEAQRRHGDALRLLGVCLDRDVAAVAERLPALGFDFPIVADGKGTQNDAALRWFAEGPVVHVIDGKGRVQALGLHAGTNDGRTELREAIDAAVSAK